MFEQFRTHYGIGAILKQADGYECTQPDVHLVSSQLGGRTFGGGVYRVHLARDVDRFTSLAKEAFPKFAHRIVCFASDWLGRQFALDAARLSAGRPQILLLEPGTGEALEIPVNVEAFHNEVLVTEPDAALASAFYARWRKSGGEQPEYEQCVGYQRPLYLGGIDDLENLALGDFEVYWNLSAQMLAKVRGLPVGSRIAKVAVSD